MSKIKVIENTKAELEKAIEFFGQELNKIHASRATPSLIEDIKVSIAGQDMVLKQLAAISLNGGGQLVVQPWSDEYLKSIEQSLRQANIGLNPIVDQKLIRINMPELSQERRENLAILINDKANQAKETVRHWWHEGWAGIRKSFDDNQISEDEKFKLKDKLQKMIAEYNDRIEKMKEDKQEEIKG